MELAPASLLGVDCGAGFTKVALFERVADRYRLIARAVARSTVQTHLYDGVARACAQIEQLTGRRLLVAGEVVAGEVSGNRGVEAFAISVTCGPPLRVAAMNEAAATAARAELCSVVALRGASVPERLRLLSQESWDAILGSPTEIAVVRRLFAQVAPERSNGERDPDERPIFSSAEGTSLAHELAALYLRKATRATPGLAELASASTQALQTGPQSLEALADLIAARFKLRLAIVDAGVSKSLVARGGGGNQPSRVERGPLPFRVWLPASLEELHGLQSSVSDALRRVAPEGLMADLAVGTGGVIAHAPRWGQVASMLLDGVRPCGVMHLATDPADVISQIAPFAATFPDIAAQVMERDAVITLGTAICPRGPAEAGEKALDLTIMPAEEGDKERLMSVMVGEVVRVPIPPDRKIDIQLFPARQLDVGLGRAGVAATTRVDGGPVGLMVDARLGEIQANSAASGQYGSPGYPKRLSQAEAALGAFG